MSATTEKAILAGGCFWGMQDLIRKRPGVLSTRVGYTGGEVDNATYRNHGSHAEAIEITFHPEQISYRDLLEFFFQVHDPTTLNRQGNDVGASYRSAIFYLDDEQRRIAEDTIADVEASGLWPGRAVLGGRTGTPGLSRALPQRLHLPLPTPRLGTPPPQRRRGLRAFSLHRSCLLPTRPAAWTRPFSGHGHRVKVH
jgi:peptide-methionine (S)-S-oxide reductase